MSRAQYPARRKPAEERRAEIVAAATRIALSEGLESLTLRRVADALGVFPGLVNHYFPVVEDLVAAAFGGAAGAELDEIFTAIDAAGTPTARMRMLVNLLVTDDRDDISLLWLDAWQAVRRRPLLRAEVSRQMSDWQNRLASLIQSGVDAGEFRADDPPAAAMRILAIVDGISVQAAMRSSIDYATVREMVHSTAERELGLRRGRLMTNGARPPG